MKHIKKIFAFALLLTMLGSPKLYLASQEYTDRQLEGFGYEETRRSAYLAPAVALGTIALVVIVAVALNNSSDHSH